MTEVAGQKTDAAKIAATVVEREVVAIAGVKCLIDNHRAAMDPAKLDELADSMASCGLMSPIAVCRRGQAPADKVDVLIYGHRRLQAAMKIGWTRITAHVYEGLSDIQIAEMQAIENLHHEDLTPVDEARAIEALIAAGGTVEQVAARIDKSPAFIRRRLDLLRLDKQIIPLVACGRLPLAHAGAIARLGDRKDQISVTRSALGIMHNKGLADGAAGQYVEPISGVRKQISWKLAKLGAARWPKDAPYAGKRACAGCVNNTNTEPVLFEGINLTSTKGNCTDPACFAIKAKAWEKDPVKIARDKKRDAARKAKGEAPILCMMPSAERVRRGKTGPTAEEAKIAAERKAFPSKAADKYAVALYAYGVKLLGGMCDRIKGKARLPVDAASCVHSMLLASRHGYVGPELLPKFRQLTAAFKKVNMYTPENERKSLGKVLRAAWENNMQAIRPSWPEYATCPYNTPVSRDAVELIDCMEALAKRWGVKINMARPKLAEFSDTSTAEPATGGTDAKAKKVRKSAGRKKAKSKTRRSRGAGGKTKKRK